MVDTTRFEQIIPASIRGRKIVVVGAGSVGSMVVFHLAKAGFTNITVYDDDVVDSTNTGTQLYGHSHVGMLKVDALTMIIEGLTGTKIVSANEKVTALPDYGQIIFVCVDTIEARKQILGEDPRDPVIIIDVRTGGTEWEVYKILCLMGDNEHYQHYLPTLEHEKYAEETCGRTSCILTSSLAANTAVRLATKLLLEGYTKKTVYFEKIKGVIWDNEPLIKRR